MKRLRFPRFDWTSVLAPRSRCTAPRVQDETSRDSHIRPCHLAGVSVNGFHHLSGVSVSFGESSDRRADAPGASAPSVSCHSDPAGCGLRARDSEREGPDFPAATSGGSARETRSFLQTTLRSLARVVGQTLYARLKGMRGRLRWFTPSRPVRELKTAKIGRGQGGSTQPIRC
jgi:hypothetical protein